ncbi:MAG: hypothetical protein ACXVEF_42445 [Polyangiales bacterium]
MAAMTLERKTRKYSEVTVANLLALPIKANTKVLLGAMIALSGGFVVPALEATGLIALGIAEQTIDNIGGADGELLVPIRQGTFLVFNSGGADALLQADVGHDVFFVDDQTVAKTDGGGKRSRAGKLLGIETDGMVWVQLAIGL